MKHNTSLEDFLDNYSKSKDALSTYDLRFIASIKNRSGPKLAFKLVSKKINSSQIYKEKGAA